MPFFLVGFLVIMSYPPSAFGDEPHTGDRAVAVPAFFWNQCRAIITHSAKSVNLVVLLKKGGMGTVCRAWAKPARNRQYPLLLWEDVDRLISGPIGGTMRWHPILIGRGIADVDPDNTL
jgi:hypothetical protein